MASQKIFVSPGVFTSEKDLTFVSQQVGVTTLGLAGETLKGPAFEPIFITNYDEFLTIFGGLSPAKFGDNKPKYELPYIAKFYLTQSNQLFVSRVLGLTGYDAGDAWAIVSRANYDPSTILANTTTYVCNGEILTLSITSSNTGTTGVYTALTGTTTGTGSTATFNVDVDGLGAITAVTVSNGGLGYLVGDLVTIDGTLIGGSSPADDVIITVDSIDCPYGTTIVTTGVTFTADFTGSTYANFTNANAEYLYNLGLFPNGALITTSDVPGVTGAYPEGIVFDRTTGVSFTGVSTTIAQTSLTGASGSISGTVITYTSSAYAQYEGLVLALLRSRGVYVSDSLNWSTSQSVNGLIGGLTPTLTNPLAQFTLSAYSVGLSASSVFDVSLDRRSSNYITGVLGEDCLDKSSRVYVEEIYPNMLQDLLDNNYILGLKQELIYISNVDNYQQQYQTPETPWVVSELRGNQVFKLFKFASISDGTAANTEIKISIQNIDPDGKEFDVVVRQFGDTDARPSILETYAKCSMEPSSNNFIARRIGTADGEFTLNSRFIMCVMNDTAPTDAFPAGFEGYRVRDYAGVTVGSPSPTLNYIPPFIDYKTAYDPENERIRRVYLGISDTVGIDTDMFQWKGKQDNEAYWSATTKGFHMDSGATIAGNFEVGEFAFQSILDIEGTLYENTTARKFTFVPYWGFDGWDCHRTSRTNTDRYRIGKVGFNTGLANGQFQQLGPQDGTSDLYAYWNNIKTFANPQAVNINVFATPGIDWSPSLSLGNNYLVQETIDMIEEQRADSVYIVTSPENVEYDTTDDTVGFGFNSVQINDAESLVDLLDAADIDSNYTATYWPWIQERDTENNVNVWLPPTLEVVRNIALTDNVSFPWYAVAGYNRGLTNALQARYKLTEDDRDTLYEGRVNPMATFSDVGVVIWGNKNLQVKDSVLDRLNIRRLLLQARQLITAVGVRLLFEQNDQIVRNQFLNLVNPILDNIRKERGLADFRVQLSNDPEEIDRNEMRGKVFLKPVPSLEYIIIEFNVTPTGASFDNI